jgi:hypothetical protein
MDDPLTPELELVNALRITAAPPQAWIDAAAMLPSTLGELGEIERLLANPDFQTAFAGDPERALADSGLPASPLVLSAVQERLAGD